jgi:hypothetical protein
MNVKYDLMFAHDKQVFAKETEKGELTGKFTIEFSKLSEFTDYKFYYILTDKMVICN